MNGEPASDDFSLGREEDERSTNETRARCIKIPRDVINRLNKHGTRSRRQLNRVYQRETSVHGYHGGQRSGIRAGRTSEQEPQAGMRRTRYYAAMRVYGNVAITACSTFRRDFKLRFADPEK